ncbi:MAG: hypothetical protein ABF608_07450 [Sporolactobacillus sp.]
MIIIWNFAELIVGLLMNVFIGHVERFIFHNPNHLARLIIRIVAVFCVIDGFCRLTHLHLF